MNGYFDCLFELYNYTRVPVMIFSSLGLPVSGVVCGSFLLRCN